MEHHQQQQQQQQPLNRYKESVNRTVKFNPLVHNIYFSDRSSQIFDSKSDIVSKQTNPYFNLPLSYLPHAAIQQNYSNQYYSPEPARNSTELGQKDFMKSLNKDEQSLACNDCYYLNEIINFKL